MENVKSNKMRRDVRTAYGQFANEGAGCGCDCGAGNKEQTAKSIGYGEEDLQVAPDSSNLSLGCGNPTGIAELKTGETVLDLGSGAGFDSFIAAEQVGPTGRVIGVDMTPEMLEKARANLERVEATNVEFRLGEIEHLPVADGTVDVVISNCVINLSPEKEVVFAEAYRVLKSGGRLSIADMIATGPMPEHMTNDPKVVASCVGAAATAGDTEGWLKAAGFEQINIRLPENGDKLVVSGLIEAVKP